MGINSFQHVNLEHIYTNENPANFNHYCWYRWKHCRLDEHDEFEPTTTNSIDINIYNCLGYHYKRYYVLITCIRNCSK